MRKLTDRDLAKILGTTVSGYTVESVRIKRGPFTDADHYGIILGRNSKDQYVTWEFHLEEDDTISAYWGHYHMENRKAAVNDFNTRDLDGSVDTFMVTITETLKLTVEVEADSSEEAERIVSDKWRNSEYVLDADNFVEVGFEAVPVDGEPEQETSIGA